MRVQILAQSLASPVTLGSNLSVAPLITVSGQRGDLLTGVTLWLDIALVGP